MKFCDICGSMLTKMTMSAGNIVFQCKQCQQTYDGTAADTLMDEEYLEMSTLESKHAVFIENSAFDPAANTVLLDCPQCKLDFLTMILTGEDLVAMYTCTCGYKATRRDHFARAK